MRKLFLLMVVSGCAAATPVEMLECAREKHRRGDLKSAGKLYEAAAEKMKGKKREKALLLAARVYYEADLWRRSYNIYEKLLDESDDKDIQQESLSRMFEIATAFVLGRSEPSWLGINVGWRDWGAERLARLAEQYPCLPQAQEAWTLVGKYWLKEGDYEEAERWFGKVLREAGDKEVRDSALFYLAECCIGRVRGVDYDMSLLEKARKFLALYLARGGTETEKAKERLVWVEEMLAQRELMVARFYIEQGTPQSARPHLRYLISEFPDTKSAEEARRLLVEMSR